MWLALALSFARAKRAEEEFARSQALERLRIKWGVTEVGPETHLMSYPPEHHYPTIDDSHDWMDEQIDDFVSKAAPGVRDYFPIVGPETEAAVSSNRAR